MTKNTKIFLGVGCGVLLLCGIAVVIGGVFAVTTWGPGFIESMDRTETQGRELGKTTDQHGCIKEGVERSKSTSLIDLRAGIELSGFVEACLSVSRRTENFCQGVPSLFSLSASEWEMAECKKAGVDPEKTGCVHVMKRKHQFCNRSH